MKSRTLTFLLLPLFLISCQKEYNQETCNKLSMQAFKGSPRHASEFKENCQDIKVTYTQEVCQKALNDLIISGNLKEVKKSYGKDVVGCFTENDMRAFRKEEKE